MTPEESLQIVLSELKEGIALAKCRKCGCMENVLRQLASALPEVGTDKASEITENVSAFLEKMQPIRYTCLGCDHCYPAVAHNAFVQAFPSFGETLLDLSCEFSFQEEGWPPVAGEYFVLDKTAPVAISTLASIQLAEGLAHRKPNALAIVGKTETENIGIEKIIKNIITNRTIRYLIVTGLDSKGHLAGRTILSLAEHGVNKDGRVVGSPARHPILRNVSIDEIEVFRKQVKIIDMLGCENLDEICLRVEELAREASKLCSCAECGRMSTVSIPTPPKIIATEHGETVKMDEAGYFVIIPLLDKGVISVEHYAYDNTLLRVIEGETARAIYSTLIKNGWVTELSHAAYLGKELSKAELSLKQGLKYIQDGA